LSEARGSSGRNAQNQESDVVGTAALEGESYQLVAGFGGRISLNNAGQIRIADHAPQTVGTK